jgi:drug/metabolite transporter (DMT)-like permease
MSACALIWGTTWYAITLQFGAADPIVSLCLRFGLATLAMFVVCRIARQPLHMAPQEHWAALGQGLFTFAIAYVLVYWAEQQLTSAAVAITFSSLAIANLLVFKAVANHRAARATWVGSLLGVAGVGVYFGLGSLGTGGSIQTLAGLGLTIAAVVASAIGNVFAWRNEQMGSRIIPGTTWAMAYGTIFLVVCGLVGRTDWTVAPTRDYVLSLLYLSVVGTAGAFLIYFWVARSHSYTLASYATALSPLIAILVSSRFEGQDVTVASIAGLLLVIAGQLMIARAPRAD